MTILDFAFVKKIKQYLSPYRQNQQRGLCGIHLTLQGVAAAVISRKKNLPELMCYDFMPCESRPEKILAALTTFVKKNQLDGMPCSWILQPREYILLPVGALPVAPEEISQALYFHVKDRINFDIAKAGITYFTLPPLNKSSTDEFIYAVVAQKDMLEKSANIIRQSGLHLSSIDIPEFALRNIANLNLAQTEAVNIGIIEFHEMQTVLMFIKSQTIHLIRQIDRDEKALPVEAVKKLGLEIQRSLDYYENELGQTPIQTFYVAGLDKASFFELQANLSFKLEVLALEGVFELSPDVQKNALCFTAIGGALRSEDAYASTN